MRREHHAMHSPIWAIMEKLLRDTFSHVPNKSSSFQVITYRITSHLKSSNLRLLEFCDSITWHSEELLKCFRATDWRGQSLNKILRLVFRQTATYAMKLWLCIFWDLIRFAYVTHSHRRCQHGSGFVMVASDVLASRTALADASEARKARLIALRKRKAGELEAGEDSRYDYHVLDGCIHWLISVAQASRSFKVAISTQNLVPSESMPRQKMMLCRTLWRKRWKVWLNKSSQKTRHDELKNWQVWPWIYPFYIVNHRTGCFQYRAKTS